MNVEIGGRAFTLTSDPKHGSVKRVRSGYKRVMYSQIDLTELDISESEAFDTEFDTLVSQQLLKNPSLLLAMTEDIEGFKKTATIMLATGLSQNVVDNLSQKTCDKLLVKCEEVLEGGVDDFFGDLESATLSPTSPTETTEK